MSALVEVGGRDVRSVKIGGGSPLVLLCGPCVIESRDKLLRQAEAISAVAAEIGIPLVFKSSYDKANRTSVSGFRGLGVEAGLEALTAVRQQLNIPVVTDVHTEGEVASAAQVADLLQIPAFLCRQTDLLQAAAKTMKPVMVKKGQMVAPQDMVYAVEKIKAAGNSQILLCERGACFGHRDLVVDFRGIEQMSHTGCPVVFDATHSVQIMGGAGGSSSGNRGSVPALARAAVAVGVSAVFIEAHESPDTAPSDGPNMLPITELPALLGDLKRIAELSLATRKAH